MIFLKSFGFWQLGAVLTIILSLLVWQFCIAYKARLQPDAYLAEALRCVSFYGLATKTKEKAHSFEHSFDGFTNLVDWVTVVTGGPSDLTQHDVDGDLVMTDIWPASQFIFLFNGLGPIKRIAKVDPRVDFPGSGSLRSLAYDPEEDVFFGITSHKFYRLAAEPSVYTPISCENMRWWGDVPDKRMTSVLGNVTNSASWLSSITYDTKRKRLLISAKTWQEYSNSMGYVSADNESTLYSFEPKTRGWSVLANTGSGLGDGLLAAMYYDAAVDKIFAIQEPTGGYPSCSGDPNVHSILQMKPDGTIEKKIRLLNPFPLSWGPTRRGNIGMQLYVHGSLAIIIGKRLRSDLPVSAESSSAAAEVETMYVYRLPEGKLLKSEPIVFQDGQD